MYVSVDTQKPRESFASSHVDVVVVGAGPYGLSTAAHLRAQGLKVAIFGKPLQLWREHMPEGMLLRSFWWASNLSDPLHQFDLIHYFQKQGQSFNDDSPYPFPMESFIDYGLWFQKSVVPDVDETYIDTIQLTDGGYQVTLCDGRVVYSRAVVMAPGLLYYAYQPVEFEHLPSELVSHTSVHRTFRPFAGKRVVIIGGGQSALESAALLNEVGAQVELVSRQQIQWLSEERIGGRSLWEQVRYPRAGIAPGWFNWSLEVSPYTFHGLPRATKDKLLRGRGSYGPAGSDWLRHRILGKLPLHDGVPFERVADTDNGVEVVLSNSKTLQADHLLLATGYRVNVWRLPMLDVSILRKIRTYIHAPVLNSRFESSVPGLYFVGISSVSSFGPFFRFVVGTDAAARKVAAAVAHQIAQVS